MLCGGRRERTADLTVERAARPKPARLVEEVGHLRRQTAKPGTRADDDGIVVDEILDLGDWGGLIEFVVRFARDLLRDELGHAPDIDLRAGLTRPLATAFAIASMWP